MSGKEVRFQGVGVAPGIPGGVVFLHHPDEEEPPKRRIDDSEGKEHCLLVERKCEGTS
jgi:hypothetical protein